MVLSQSHKTEQLNGVRCSKYYTTIMRISKKAHERYVIIICSLFPFLLFYQSKGDLHVEVMIECILYNKIIISIAIIIV
jgi:hypothetical protein